jgi:ElaB/YqjD/DUF883 family membrane-anchored ribosome-binding protein
MSNTTSETMNKANGLANDFKNKIQNTEDQLERISHNVGEKLGAKASQIANTTNDYVKTGREYVQENPMKGIAIAAATGLVIGSILTMAMRRR